MKVLKFDTLINNNNITGITELISNFSNNNEASIVFISGSKEGFNTLSKITQLFFDGKNKDAIAIFHQYKSDCIALSNNICISTPTQLNDLFTEVEWLLHDKAVRTFNYYHDQIICCNNLVYSAIISGYLTTKNIENKWIDSRDIVKTDSYFTAANINEEQTKQSIISIIKHNIVITQNDLGSTEENESTILKNCTLLKILFEKL